MSCNVYMFNCCVHACTNVSFNVCCETFQLLFSATHIFLSACQIAFSLSLNICTDSKGLENMYVCVNLYVHVLPVTCMSLLKSWLTFTLPHGYNFLQPSLLNIQEFSMSISIYSVFLNFSVFIQCLMTREPSGYQFSCFVEM